MGAILFGTFMALRVDPEEIRRRPAQDPFNCRCVERSLPHGRDLDLDLLAPKVWIIRPQDESIRPERRDRCGKGRIEPVPNRVEPQPPDGCAWQLRGVGHKAGKLGVEATEEHRQCTAEVRDDDAHRRELRGNAASDEVDGRDRVLDRGTDHPRQASLPDQGGLGVHTSWVDEQDSPPSVQLLEQGLERGIRNGPTGDGCRDGEADDPRQVQRALDLLERGVHVGQRQDGERGETRRVTRYQIGESVVPEPRYVGSLGRATHPRHERRRRHDLEVDADPIHELKSQAQLLGAIACPNATDPVGGGMPERDEAIDVVGWKEVTVNVDNHDGARPRGWSVTRPATSTYRSRSVIGAPEKRSTNHSATTSSRFGPSDDAGPPAMPCFSPW